jgi:hypothetical protein
MREWEPVFVFSMIRMKMYKKTTMVLTNYVNEYTVSIQEGKNERGEKTA